MMETGSLSGVTTDAVYSLNDFIFPNEFFPPSANEVVRGLPLILRRPNIVERIPPWLTFQRFCT